MKKKPRKPAPDLISRAELARRRGVARSSATRACETRLKAAVAGDMVDAAHPSVRKWLKEGAQAPTPKASKKAASTGPTLEDFSALTYRKRRAEVEELENKLERQAGRLIALEFVRQKVLGPVETLFHRLLTDFVASAARTTSSAVLSGGSLIEIQTLLRERLASELARAQRDMVNGLRHCKAGPNPPEVQEPAAHDTAASRDHAARSAFAQAVIADLRANATPKLVAAVVKALGRAAGGRFDEVFALLPRVEQEAVEQAAAMLDGHVQKSLSRMAQHDENQDDPH